MADSLVELEARDRIGFVTLNNPARRAFYEMRTPAFPDE